MMGYPGAELTTLALAASIVIGGATLASFRLILRTGFLKRNAGARFAIWFAILISLAGAGPAFFTSGSVRLHQIPTISVRPAAPRTASRRISAITAPRPAIHAAPQPATPQHFNLALLGLLLWLTGTVASLARVALGMLRLRQIVGASDLVETRLTARGPVRILASDHFAVPVAIGYRRPAIIVPRGLLELESDTDIENVLLHELEHLRRFDDLTSLLQAACMSALWFNPFAYSISRRIGIDREMACDEAVVTRTGRRATYAATLWRMAVGASDVVAPALLSAFSSGPHTAPRVENLLSARGGTLTPRRWLVVALSATFSIAALCGATMAAAMALAPSPVKDFANVALPCGESLIVGGKRADGTAVNQAALYDAHGHFSRLVSMPVGVWLPTATRLRDGNVLVTGGLTPTGATAASEIYDVEHHVFESIAPMNVARSGQTAVLHGNGTVVITGGTQAGAPMVQTEIYNPSAHRFTLK